MNRRLGRLPSHNRTRSHPSFGTTATRPLVDRTYHDRCFIILLPLLPNGRQGLNLRPMRLVAFHLKASCTALSVRTFGFIRNYPMPSQRKVASEHTPRYATLKHTPISLQMKGLSWCLRRRGATAAQWHTTHSPPVPHTAQSRSGIGPGGGRRKPLCKVSL